MTTALLGTDRRPVPNQIGLDQPASDPATRVLELAAEHRAAALAGRRPDAGPPAPIAPDERLTLAPEAAQQLLGALVVRPDPVLVNAWLAACAAGGLGAPPDLWPRLAGLAARSTGYDRPLLLRVLGPRGRWFLDQHPQWRRLTADPVASAAVVTEGPAVVKTDPAEALAAVQQATSDAEAMQLVLDCPDPWPAELITAAQQLVATDPLGPGTPAAVRLGWERLRRTVQIRTEIGQAFGATPPARDHQDTTGEALP